MLQAEYAFGAAEDKNFSRSPEIKLLSTKLVTLVFNYRNMLAPNSLRKYNKMKTLEHLGFFRDYSYFILSS